MVIKNVMHDKTTTFSRIMYVDVEQELLSMGYVNTR